MPQFDTSSFISQLFWLLIVFVILYFIVRRFIVPRAESILKSRNCYIEENISCAEDYKNKANILNLKKQEKLIEVNIKAEEIRQRAIKLIESQFVRQKKDLSVALDHEKKVAISEIKKYIDKFQGDNANSCVFLAAFIIEKITSKPANINLIKKIHSRTQ